jgi:hypothetical protein
MPHPIPQPDQAPARRRFLARLTAATAALGAAAGAWPLLASLAPAADTLAQDETVLDLAGRPRYGPARFALAVPP